jgi:hypothetical protein
VQKTSLFVVAAEKSPGQYILNCGFAIAAIRCIMSGGSGEIIEIKNLLWVRYVGIQDTICGAGYSGRLVGFMVSFGPDLAVG